MGPEDLRNWAKEHPKVDDRISETEEKQKNKARKNGKTKRRHKARGQASQMPEIFGQLGVGKRKSQNKQIVWQKKLLPQCTDNAPATTSSRTNSFAYLLLNSKEEKGKQVGAKSGEFKIPYKEHC